MCFRKYPVVSGINQPPPEIKPIDQEERKRNCYHISRRVDASKFIRRARKHRGRDEREEGRRESGRVGRRGKEREREGRRREQETALLLSDLYMLK